MLVLSPLPLEFIWKIPDYFTEIIQEMNSRLIFILLQDNPVKIVSDYTICPELKSSAFSLQIRPLFSILSSFLRTRNSLITAFVLSSIWLLKWWNGDFQQILVYLYELPLLTFPQKSFSTKHKKSEWQREMPLGFVVSLKVLSLQKYIFKDLRGSMHTACSLSFHF